MTRPLLEQALDRTLLLMRDNVRAEVTDEELVRALTSTTVALVATEDDLRTHSAQCAYVTAALQMARSAHRVTLLAPDVPLVGAQPPLTSGTLVSGLVEVGKDLLPGVEFSTTMPDGPMDLAVYFGRQVRAVSAKRSISVNATAWSALITPAAAAGPWGATDWPMGAIASGALAATEAFKHSMRGLSAYANDDNFFSEQFATVDQLALLVAPETTAQNAALDAVDFVSGGAITQAALYVLLRVPGVSGRGRVIDPECTDLPNLNRYALLRRSHIEYAKTHLLRELAGPGLSLETVDAKFQDSAISLHPRVVVGVDDIPTRWRVQEARPQWLGIGATTHWSAMASHHHGGVACARCLHPRDDSDVGRIPTVSFVSLFAGLFVASYLLRSAAGEGVPAGEQYLYFSPLRPERVWRSPVSARPMCPTCAVSKMAA